LTSFRAALVKTESLAETAVDLSLGEYILMSKGEESTGGRERPYILANTYEAVLGFLYLDQGLEKSREFVARTLIPKIDNIVEHRLDIDNKSKLQELSQEILKLTPSYDLISEEGPDHEKKFTLAVMIGETKFGTGEGFSKQEAAQNAAGDALENWEESVRNYENKNK
ncbi:MAG TPA: putative dsRNA-binding protein, partial [Candidatus Dojkabacteria bacterium]